MRLIVLFALLCTFLMMVTCSLVPELKTWAENRYIQCVHCMDYDRSHISLFGCKPRRPILCNGNACFMRFHKEFSRPSIMYTSGCLNLTKAEMETISKAQKNSPERGNPDGTLLCEVSDSFQYVHKNVLQLAERTDTCVCTNMDKCNFINLSPDFSEYNRTPLLRNVLINEVNHMKMFLPHEYRRLTYRMTREQGSANKIRVFWMLCILFSLFHRLAQFI